MGNRKKVQVIIHSIFWIYAIALLAAMLVNAWFNDLGSDSAVQIKYCRQSLETMMTWVKGDFHPPFYHFMLWCVCHILPDASQVYSIFSAIPFVLVTIAAGTFIYKEFGGVSSFLLVTFWGLMSQSLYHQVEARMYGWGAFFLFAGMLSLYYIFKANMIKYWTLFAIFSLMGMYTHYYVLIQFFFIVLYLLIHAVAFRRDLLKRTLITSIGLAVCYVPWLFVLLKQSSVVQNGDYWITEVLSPRTCIWYLFSFAKGYELLFIFLFVLTVNYIIIKKIIYIQVVEGKKKIRIKLANLFVKANNHKLYLIQVVVLSGVATIATGLILSHLMHPMILDRYIYFPAIGFWLVIPICISMTPNKWGSGFVGTLVMGMILWYNIPILCNTISDQIASYKFKERLYEVVNPNAEEPGVIITDWVMKYYPLSSYYYPSWEVIAIDKMDISLYEAISQIPENEKVYCFVSDQLEELDNTYNFEYIDAGTIGESFSYVYEVNR
ncbi:MAG: glycosyltransferase family 39 protein [Lachnospiraceae bacterium]|nr:glycosyltransferase family 39 protein [Lachnospiraceae bacterium]